MNCEMYRFVLRMPDELRFRLEQRANELERATKVPLSLNRMILVLIEEALERKGRKR